MRKINMSKKVLSGLALASLMISVALAIVFQQTPVDHNVTIVGIYEFTLYEDEACTIPLVSIEWGEVCHNGEPHLKTVYAKNTGNEPCSLSWNSTNIPEGMTLTMELSGTPWTQNTVLGLGQTGVKRNILMGLSADPAVPLGDFSFTTTFYGHDA